LTDDDELVPLVPIEVTPELVHELAAMSPELLIYSMSLVITVLGLRLLGADDVTNALVERQRLMVEELARACTRADVSPAATASADGMAVEVLALRSRVVQQVLH